MVFVKQLRQCNDSQDHFCFDSKHRLMQKLFTSDDVAFIQYWSNKWRKWRSIGAHTQRAIVYYTWIWQIETA